MAVQWLGYFLDNRDERLKDSLLLTAIALADHADMNGKCCPGLDMLAMKARISTRQVKRLIQKLEELGYLDVVRGTGRGNPSHYQLKRPEPGLNEKVTPVTPFVDKEKVTSVTPFKQVKGDTGDTLSEQEKVTKSTVKGDIAMSFPPRTPHKENLLKPFSEIDAHPREAVSKDAFGEANKDAFHPLIREIIKLTGKPVDAFVQQDLIDLVGSDFDKARLRDCYRRWRIKGYNPTNYSWVTEWYLAGSSGAGNADMSAEDRIEFARTELCQDCNSDGLAPTGDGALKRCKHPSVPISAVTQGAAAACL